MNRRLLGPGPLNPWEKGDETWVHSWEPELKRQSACGPDTPRPQKVCGAIVDLKVMHITFFDRHGLIIFNQPVSVDQRVDDSYNLSNSEK